MTEPSPSASTGPFSRFEFLVAGRYLRARRKERFVSVIASLTLVGVAIGVAKAYQSPRPEVVATFDYAYMIFAVLWGFVFFREVPDLWTLGGMALITAGGLIVLKADREARR